MEPEIMHYSLTTIIFTNGMDTRYEKNPGMLNSILSASEQNRLHKYLIYK